MSLKEIVDKNQQFLDKKNVIGVGAGKKFANGTPTGEDALVFFVEQKVDKAGLSKRDIVPSSVDGYETDVFNIGRIEARALRRKIRPITPGFGCGHGYVTAGTIGGIFMRNDKPVILSNNHVMAWTNKAKKGHAIINPALHDGGDLKNPYHRIARLVDFVKMTASGNYQDSAIAELFSEVSKNDYTAAIYNIGEPTGVTNAVVDMPVQKTGRTTGYTTGRVVSVGASVSVAYDGNQIKRFKDCILTTDMSKGGDSGSLLLDMNKRIVGLLFAGSSKVTVHNPIKYPMESYGLELIKNPLSIVENKVRIYKNTKKLPNEFDTVEEAKQYAINQMMADEDVLKLTVKSDLEIIRDMSNQIIIEYDE